MIDEKIEEQRQRYQQAIDRVAERAFYPPVQVQVDEGMVWLVCAAGHRWGSIDPEAGCRQCRENHALRLKGRTECEEEGCTNVVACKDEAWESGRVRKCKLHWVEEKVATHTIAGPVCLDNYVSVLAEYCPEDTWNGWLCPKLDAWTVQHILTLFKTSDPDYHDEYGYDWKWQDDLSLVLTERQWKHEEPDTYKPEILAPNEEGLYALGNYSWTWSEDPEFYDTDEHRRWNEARGTVWRDAYNARNQELHATGQFQMADSSRDEAGAAAVAEWEKTHPEPPKDAAYTPVPGEKARIA